MLVWVGRGNIKKLNFLSVAACHEFRSVAAHTQVMAIGSPTTVDGYAMLPVEVIGAVDAGSALIQAC